MKCSALDTSAAILGMRQKFSNSPNVLCKARFHGGRNAQAAVDAAEVVLSEMDCDSGFQILQFLRERFGKAREATKSHALSLVLALDIAGGNVKPCWDSRFAPLDITSTDITSTIGLGEYPFVLAIVAIELRQLREVHIKPNVSST